MLKKTIVKSKKMMKTPTPFLRTWIALSLASLLVPAYAGQVDIELPNSGWRYSDKNVAGFAQEVHYPAVSVSANGHPDAALIRGRIADAHKGGKANKLIVNGVAMPLLIDDNGNFARPYSFGPGSNSVEVRAVDGSRKRVQFFDGRSGKVQSKLRIVMSWNTPDNDLDLHVISPDGQHVFYAARQADNGGALDVDVTTGYGPEIYATPSPVRGLYHVFVNYYGSGQNTDAITVAQVSIITNENTPNEKQQVFSVPMRRAGDLTLVKSFMY